jgi:hypothetical protein
LNAIAQDRSYPQPDYSKSWKRGARALCTFGAEPRMTTGLASTRRRCDSAVSILVRFPIEIDRLNTYSHFRISCPLIETDDEYVDTQDILRTVARLSTTWP